MLYTALKRLPVRDQWYRREEVDPATSRITEPAVHPFLRSNMWFLRGRSSSLLFDTGIGIAPLRPELPEIETLPCTLIVSHGHLDHSGSAAEFSERWVHADEPIGASRAATLRATSLAQLMELPLDTFVDADPWLISEVPESRFDPGHYTLPEFSPTARLAGGERIDLGGRVLEVLHLPGHTPGSIALWEEGTRTLYSGDVLYDDELLDCLPESDIARYRESLQRLTALDVHEVRPGHGHSFSGARMRELISAYVRASLD